MRIKALLFLCCLVSMVIFSAYSFGLEKNTHLAINQEVAQRTINSFSLGNYLKNELGFMGGVDEPLYGYSGKMKIHITQKVWQWLGEGGFTEDEPLWRSFRHFHNPLKPWDTAGLKDSHLKYEERFRYSNHLHNFTLSH
ncbi:MAG: hypothetical protein HY805_01195 [Nitrospirae bacterium]|nr:hypothetical protein [Nitrospirota bacterium]